ncbi:DNA polymerase III subunit gamma/tau [Prevotella bivia]|uniref:DNA polymerase III subunit gamma/tau n=1 Tax=Prevotella bivia TaxID=28125 RepID=A0A137SZV7_9BACT|nr:DNA polymerase III subunit gamma/tau [Prevotella bivia]KXO17974.1 DNA polymerase III, subunit gamma and tau [Prevotella bivia]
MSEYIVSARKYRPATFDSVVGQTALTTTLKNAVKSGKLAHAYLFCGPRGVGKTTTARIFAKAINCEHPTSEGEACNECESCKAFNEGRSYNIFELDAASNNSVENIKDLMEQTRIPPQIGKYKVFIIDEVHMLSSQAFNAFLKTLEEPPAQVIFILATTEKHKILPTILSRCQIYDFERMSVPDIIEHLKRVAAKENITYDEKALNIIAEKADGGMRDALSIFDQVASFSQGNITYQKVIEDLNVLDEDNYFNIIDLALQNKVSDIMVVMNNAINKGFDAGRLINGLASHVRNVLMAKDVATLPLLEASEQQKTRYQKQAAKCPTSFLYKALQKMNQCDVNYRQSSNKRLLAELTLIEVAQITQPEDTDMSASGRSPKRLKSLFKNLVISTQQKTAQQVAGSTKHIVYREGAVATSIPSSRANASAQTLQKSIPEPAKVNLQLSSIGLSFDHLLKKDRATNTVEEEVEITNKEENETFSAEDLLIQWRAMCSRMPNSMQALASRMKNITPTITTFPEIQVLAENKIQLNELLAIKARIRSTMAKELKNGKITVAIRLAKQEEIVPALSPYETLEKLKKENKALTKLIEAFKLDLA